MKRIISLILTVVMVLSSITVFADSMTSKEMQDVLIKVKGRVDIPTELTEFTPQTSKQEGKTLYSFLWQSADGNAYIEVSADGGGRILQYYAYDNSLKSDKKLTALSKAEIIGTAESFLKKTAPEAFANNDDKLVYDEDSWYVNNLSYQLSFRRFRDGIEVKDNNASINIRVYDDKAYVRNAYINFNYDAKFSNVPESVADYKEKYKAAFPAELIYKDEYSYFEPKSEDDKDKVVLVYRYKDNEAGYILAENGEVATEDEWNETYFGSTSNGVAEDALMSSRKEMLTEQEIRELDMVEGVISKDDIEKILKKLPYIDFDNALKTEYYSINKVDEKYRVSVSYENDSKRYLSVTADGATGEILSIYNRAYHETFNDAQLTENQKAEANKKIDEFLKAAAKEKVNEFAEQNSNTSNWGVSRDFDRIVNGVRYVDDGIFVEFDNDANRITSYRLDYEEKVFPKTEKIIDGTAAYDAILDIAPLKRIYILTDGTYKVCFTATDAIMVDAFTGEKYLNGIEESAQEFKYSDIDGHWAQEMINKLAEIQIGFKGEKFNPDEPVTQYDLLKFFGAGIRYKGYLTREPEMLYQELINEGILTEEEKSPDSVVKREDAFVYMIRFDGMEEVAKLSNIFKVEYADKNLISDGKIGYPAILTGMGIICGDGGYLRPTEILTRAEAAVMLYKYMIK